VDYETKCQCGLVALQPDAFRGNGQGYKFLAARRTNNVLKTNSVRDWLAA
jgi:hypothetical protein